MYSCLCSSPDCRVNGCSAQREAQAGRANKLPLGQFVHPPAPSVSPLAYLVGNGVKQSVKQGWECPRCRAILAPHVDRCTCKVPA